MRQVKASALATNEAYTLTETTLPPGLGAPRHVHAEHEEAFYVLHGQVSFQVSGERIEASVGDFVLVPRGVEHAFDITGGQPAQYLCIFSPPITDRERESLAQQVSAYKEQAT
jgi:quercetin dioxygenase-like cupin family protein